LQSANEEILSSNEELQSTNEELETAKEELQSTNEELSTVNDELRNRNLQISEGQRDLKGVLNSISIAVVGSDSVVRDFTPHVQNILGLLPQEVGKTILGADHISEIPDFRQLVQKALSATDGATEVADRSGKLYLFQVLSFKASDGKPDGHIVTLVESGLGR